MRITDIISEHTQVDEKFPSFRKSVTDEQAAAIRADTLRALRWMGDATKAVEYAIKQHGKIAKKIAAEVVNSQDRRSMSRLQTETTAGSVAGVAGGLGGGDPAASIYTKKPKKKTTMIKRSQMENNNEENS